MGEPKIFKSEGFIEGMTLTMPGEGNGLVILACRREYHCVQKPSHSEDRFRDEEKVQMFGNLVGSTSSVVPSEIARGGLNVNHFTRVDHGIDGFIFP